MKFQQITIIYFIVLALELVGDFVFAQFQMPYLVWFFKPLLMLVLLYGLWQERKGQLDLFEKLIAGALVFSWLGDVFLMPNLLPQSIQLLAGLVPFLIAHVLYIVAFIRTKSEKKAILKRRPHLVFPFLFLEFGLISYLMNAAHPDFLPLKIPVVIYATVIMIMVLTAINRYDRVSHASFRWITLGAILFMFSDSLIAMNRFTTFFDGQTYLASFLIMSLYGIGQYWIVKGVLLNREV